MSAFSAAWLALREPYDAKARNADVLDAVAVAFADRSSVAIVDLACGLGSTLRTITTRLPQRQDWRLVDNNLGLLVEAAMLARPPDLTVTTRAIDLDRDLEIALDGPIDLITTSALLDLVSEEWLDRFITESAARRLPVYAALTYQGRVTLDPPDPFDLEIVAAVNRHQRRDKGFGPALGPEAAIRAVRTFERVGYGILPGSSDWVFEPADRKMQSEVLTGWADAANELGDLRPPAVAAWLARRRELIIAGRSRLRIAHVDLFATPTATR